MSFLTNNVRQWCWVSVLAFGIFAAAGPNHRGTQTLDIITVTTDGKIEDADLSLDGRQVATVVRHCVDGLCDCSEELQIWDVPSAKVISRTLLTVLSQQNPSGGHVRYSQDGFVVVHDGAEGLRVFTNSLRHIASFPIGLKETETSQLAAVDAKLQDRIRALLPKHLQAYKHAHLSHVVRLQVPDHLRASLVIAVGGSSSMVRVIDLLSGNVLHQWTFAGSLAKVAWSPTGTKLAIALPFADRWTQGFYANVVVFDTKTWNVLRSFDVERGFERYQLGQIGDIAFAGENRLAVASSEVSGVFYRPAVKIIDVTTGRIVKAVHASGTGAGAPFSVSRDGKTLIAYTAPTARHFDWETLSVYQQPDHQHFTLWSLAAAQPVALSSDTAVYQDGTSVMLNQDGTEALVFTSGGTLNRMVVLRKN